jgi:hypothetical protein
MKLPKTITVAGHTIKIVYKKALIVNGVECWGVWSDDSHTIYLKSGMDRTRKLEIFLHEVIHAISDIHILSLSEKSVKLLALELLATIRNNKIQLLDTK